MKQLAVILILLVSLVACDKKQEVPPKPRFATAPLTTAQGQRLYARACASCHGVQGKGNGPRSRMIGSLPDFTTADFQLSHPDEQLKTTIDKGRGKMPAFGFRFGKHEQGALVSHIRSLGPQ